MNALFIDAQGDTTPAVTLDSVKGVFEISGWSHPEDAIGLYAPVFAWLAEYQKSPVAQTDFHFKLQYYNTASAKQIFRLISALEEVAKNGKVTICWHHDEEDLDMLASGERFSKMSTLPFRFMQN